MLVPLPKFLSQDFQQDISRVFKDKVSQGSIIHCLWSFQIINNLHAHQLMLVNNGADSAIIVHDICKISNDSLKCLGQNIRKNV